MIDDLCILWLASIVLLALGIMAAEAIVGIIALLRH